MEEISDVLYRIKILSADKSFTSLRVMGIDIWPVVKRDIYIQAIYKIREKNSTSFLTKLKMVLNLFEGLYSFLRWLVTDSKGSKLILSYSTFNRKFIDGRWVDPYTEYYTNLEDSWVRLEVAHRGIRKKPTVHTVKVPSLLSIVFKLLSPLLRITIRILYPHEVNLLNKMSPNTLNSLVDIYLFSIFWRVVLIHKRILHVGIVGWNQNISVGLNVSAVKLEIPVFEVVHGKVWSGKPMSTGFSERFNCLPNELVVRDEIQKNIVLQSNLFLKARVQPDLYKMYIQKNINYDIESRVALESIVGDEGFITVCLAHDDLPDRLFEFFYNLRDVRILLRPHPGLGNAIQYIDFKNIYKLQCLQNVDIIDVSTISLECMLLKTKSLFAFGSTTLIDAVTAGVPAILMDDVYAVQFKEYIDEGKIIVLRSEDDIMAVLKKLL